MRQTWLKPPVGMWVCPESVPWCGCKLVQCALGLVMPLEEGLLASCRVVGDLVSGVWAGANTVGLLALRCRAACWLPSVVANWCSLQWVRPCLLKRACWQVAGQLGIWGPGWWSGVGQLQTLSAYLPFVAELLVGCHPFFGITPKMALGSLRAILKALIAIGWKWYGTHDLRRGHARDLQFSGKHLFHILSAGEWKSPAFLACLDLTQLVMGAVVEAHLAEASTEDEGEPKD